MLSQGDLLAFTGRGKTVHASAAQRTGALIASKKLGYKMRCYLELLYIRGPRTDHVAYDDLKHTVAGLSSINSIRGALVEVGLVTSVDTVKVTLANGQKSTRTRWALTASGRAAMTADILGESKVKKQAEPDAAAAPA